MKKKGVDLKANPALIKVYASKTASQSDTLIRMVVVLHSVLQKLLVRVISDSSRKERYVVPLNVPLARSDAHRTLKQMLTCAGLVVENGRTLWRSEFQVLRVCCEPGLLPGEVQRRHD